MDDASRHATLGLDTACANAPVSLETRRGDSVAALRGMHATRHGHGLVRE
jgi:hypothetical protein